MTGQHITNWPRDRRLELLGARQEDCNLSPQHSNHSFANSLPGHCAARPHKCPGAPRSGGAPPAGGSGEGSGAALDFAGTFPDAFDAQFAVEALGHVFPHVPAAAEDLHGAVGDPPGHLGAVELRHRALRVRDLDIAAAVEVAGGLNIATSASDAAAGFPLF